MRHGHPALHHLQLRTRQVSWLFPVPALLHILMLSLFFRLFLCLYFYTQAARTSLKSQVKCQRGVLVCEKLLFSVARQHLGQETERLPGGDGVVRGAPPAGD